MGIKKEKTSQDLQKYIKKGEWEKAVLALDQLSKFEPKNPIYRLRKGDYCLKVGAMQKAIEAYHQAASLFAEGGFIVKALAAYKVILRLDPRNSGAHERMQHLHTQAQESVGAQPFRVGAEAAPAGPMAISPEEQPPLELERTQELLVERESEWLDEGVVGVQPPDLESYIVPMQEDLPAGEKVELSESSMLEMEPTSLADFPAGEGAEPVGAVSRPEPNALSGSQKSVNVIPLFSSLSPEEFREVVERMIHLDYPPHYRIIKEGEKGDSVFVISQGKVKVVTTIGDREIYLTDLGENDFFGEVAFLTGRPRTASVITTEDTEILELRWEDLGGIIKRYPRVGEVLENFYRARVRDTIARVKSERAIV